MIKILLVDDHVLIRKGIALLLGNYPDITVVGEASDGEEAIQLAYQTEPNVILMDISIPNGLDGFTATKEIKKNLPEMKVIMLTMHNEIAYIQQAMEVGADGYILKKIVKVAKCMKRFKVSIQDAATMKSDCHENKSKNYLRKKEKTTQIFYQRVNKKLFD